MFKHSLVFIILQILSFASTSAEKLRVGTNTDKPPYVIQQTNSGFEIELLENVFKRMGESVEFQYIDYGNGNGARVFEKYELDVLVGVNDRMLPNSTLLSDIYIEYRNVVISLAENAFEIKQISDLSQYSIASFPLADKALGVDFSKAVNKSPLFLRMFEQDKQPEMLMRKRVDVLVIEKQIFNYYLQQTKWKDSHDKITVHPLFPVNRFSVAFKDKDNLAPFNAALKAFLASSEYLTLQQKYSFR